MKHLIRVNSKIASEQLVEQRAAVFFVEVASNLYFIQKHRSSKDVGSYVDASYVARELNTRFDIALRKQGGELVANFENEFHREFSHNAIHREVL